MNKLAFCMNPDGCEAEIEAKLDTLLSLGIDCVGANELDPVGYFDRNELNKQAIASFGRHIERRKMKVVTTHGVGGFVAIDRTRQQCAMNHLKREVDRTAMWSCPCLVFHFRQPAMRWSKVEMAEWTREIALAGLADFDARYCEVAGELCDYAAGHGVKIFFETMGPPYSFAVSVEQVLEIVRTLGRESLGVCVDTGHVHASSHAVASQIRMTQGIPLTVHLNDNIGPIPPNYDIYDSDLHLVPGLGTIDWVATIQALWQVNYTGPYIFEGVHFPNAVFEESVALTIKNWQALERLAKALPNPMIHRLKL